MLPPTCAAMPLDLRMCPVSAVVVVLPFDPVIPMILAFQKPARQFQIADDPHSAPPRRFHHRRVRRNARRQHDQIRIRQRSVGLRLHRDPFHRDRFLVDRADRRSFSRNNSTAATPLRAIPTTTTFAPSSFI